MDTSANLINNELIYSTITNTEQDVESKTYVDDLQNRMYSNNPHQTQLNQFTYETPNVVSTGIPQYTNVLLIDIRVPSYKTFVESVNADTYPVVYSPDCSSTKLLEFLRGTFTSIPRLGYCFVSNGDAPTVFLDNTPLFPFTYETPSVVSSGIAQQTTGWTEPNNLENANSNVKFIVNLINEFSIKHVDFLGCNTLNYTNWQNYYDCLTQLTGVVVGASNDKTGNIKHGGDWIMESTRQDIERIYFTESIENYSYLLDNTEWITTTTPTSSFSPIQKPLAMACDGTYIYGSYNDNTKNSIFRIHIENKTVELSWVSNNELKTYIWQMVVYNGQLYGTLGSGSVFRIDTANPSNYTFNLFPKVSIFFRGIAAHNNKLYITSYTTANIYVYNLSNSAMETTAFIGNTIRTYLSSLSITATNQQIALGHLFIYGGYLYAATNETNRVVNRVFRWKLTDPLTDNNMNFMAQGTDPLVSQSILPDRVGGWVLVNNQLYFVRNNTPNTPTIISRLNMDNLSDYTYNYYTLPINNTYINSGLTSDAVSLYFQDNRPTLYQINLIRPTTPTSTVSFDSGNTYTVSPGNLQVSIIDPSNGYNDVYYQYSITGVNENVFVTANTFSTGTGVSSFRFYVSNLFALNGIVYTINVVAKNQLGTSAVASQSVLLYTLPAQITNCSVVYADGNINVSITESSPPTYYYLNNVSYLYYLYSSGTNDSNNLLAYTVAANVTSASYTTIFAIPNIPVTTTKYKIYVIARNQLGNTIANSFSTNVYSIPSATVSFDAGNTKTVSSGNLKVQFVDPSNLSINDVYYYYSINNNVDASFANTFVNANVSPYAFFVTTTDISNTIYLKAVNPIGRSSPEANLQVVVYQAPRQPSVKFDLVGSGNVQVSIIESTIPPIPYYYLNGVSYYLYVYNTFGGNNLSGNTSTLVYNTSAGVLSNTNSTYENIVSYVKTGLTANTYTMYVTAVNSVGVSVPVYGNIDVYITPPFAPSIDAGNTVCSTSGTLTVSITDNVNGEANGIYYWYSTDNITYANSRVAKTKDTTYRFTITDTGNVLVPLTPQPYSIYVRAVNPLGYATSTSVIAKVYTTPQLPTIVEDNTYLTPNKRMTVSFIDAVNSFTNDIYYWYSTDNITYANSRVAKTTDTAYQFTITDTGNVLVPLGIANYTIYVRAQNPLSNATTSFYPVATRYIPMSKWLDYERNSNKFKQSYFMNFIDVNGECIVRNGSITVENDGTFTGNVYSRKNIQVSGSANILTDLQVDRNAVVNANLSVRETTNINRVNAIGDASFNANIYVSNNANLNKLSVAGDASVNGNMVVMKNTILNQNTTVMGKIYGASDMNIAGKMTIEQDASLLSSLGVFGNTNIYGYRNFSVLNFLRTTNVQADYNFLERSATVDPLPSDDPINNPFVLNSFTNTTDASFESISRVNISSSGIKYFGSSFNDGGLLTNPVSSQSLTNVTAHMLVNFDPTTSAIAWDFFEILTKTDASYSSLYIFKLVSNTRINPDGSNNQFVISNNTSNSNTLSNSTLKSGTNMWISVSQNIQNGDSSVYFNGNLMCSFTSVVASSTVKTNIAYSIGYSRSSSTFNPAINTGAKTIKRVIIDYNGKYTGANIPQIIDVFNSYNTLYVLPMFNVNSDSIVVNGNAKIQNNADIMKNATINQQLIVVGDVSFSSNLVVSKNATINQQLNVVGDVSFGSNLIVSKNATINQQLNVFGDASFNKNITANTMSIIGDVSFISPVGTLYANNIKLKRTPGIIGTTTSIESNTISTGGINVDTLTSTNSIHSNYINATGAITTNSLSVADSNTSVTIASGAVTASSFTAKGSGLTAAAGEMVALKLRITDSIVTEALSAVSISIGSSITTSGSVTASKEMRAESFSTKNVSAAAAGEISGEKLKASDTITATNTVTAGSFATTGKTANSGEVNCENITASNNITANGIVKAVSFQTTGTTGVISISGVMSAGSFKTNLAPYPADAGGLSVTTVKANSSITTDGAVFAQSFNTTNMTCTIASSGNVTATSFATTGRTAVAGQVNANTIVSGNTITATGAVIAASFTTTGKTAVVGQVTVTTVNATGAVTAASFNATSDKRLKQNINEMPSQWENIKVLNPVEYHWTDNSKYDCGFIAQQIYTVYPHLRPNLENVVIQNDDCPVTKESGEPVYYTIDYGKMTPYLCKGLQEVMSETEQLKREIADLKAQIQSLRELRIDEGE